MSGKKKKPIPHTVPIVMTVPLIGTTGGVRKKGKTK